MADIRVTCTISFDGTNYTDFSEFVDVSRTVGVQAEFMNKTGFGKTTPRYGFRVTNIAPAGTPPVDLEGKFGGVATVEYDDGTRVTYSNVTCLEVGDETANSTDAISREYTFGASTRVVEQ